MKASDHHKTKQTIEKMSPDNKVLAIGIVLFVGFLAIASVVFSKITQNFDSQLALIIYNANFGPAFASIMIVASEYGRESFWIPVIGIMLVFGKQNTKILAIELAILFVIGIISGEGLKYFMFRPRPYETVSGIVARLSEISDSSFPSGHALIVSIGAIFALIKFKGTRAKLAAVILAIEAATVSYSRVYLGLHYPLDVLGGIVLACSIDLIGLFVIENYFGKSILWAANHAEKIINILHISQCFRDGARALSV